MKNAKAFLHRLLAQSPRAANHPGSLALNRQDDAANEHLQGCELASEKGLVTTNTARASKLRKYWAGDSMNVAGRHHQTQTVRVCEGVISLAPPFRKACPF